MRDTYCDYCNIPNTLMRTTTTGFTTTELTARLDFEDAPQIAISVFHQQNNSGALIWDGHFDIPINFCPKCGRDLYKR